MFAIPFGTMVVIPETTLSLIQTLPFLVSLLAMYFILWAPLLSYLEEREAANQGARDSAAHLNKEIEQRLLEIDQKLQVAKESISEKKSAVRTEAHQAEAKLLSEARAAAEKEISAALTQIESAGKAASASLKPMAITLSNEIASQVLGRGVQA